MAALGALTALATAPTPLATDPRALPKAPNARRPSFLALSRFFFFAPIPKRSKTTFNWTFGPQRDIGPSVLKGIIIGPSVLKGLNRI